MSSDLVGLVDLVSLVEAVKHERELRILWQSAHERDHAFMAKAVEVAKEAVDIRLESMNALRTQITEERGTFLLKETFDTVRNEWQKWREITNERLASFVSRDFYDERHEALKLRMETVEKLNSNMAGRLWMLGAAISAVVVIINLAIKFIK